ncbi:AtpZ/AtpI family protein [Acidobacteria bacterium AH-259-L09]|nr:AtpZ/AtpI family protein [Acidobacteria bacterium AH-259-L09]
MPDRPDDFLSKSFQYFQQVVRKSGPAATASYTLVGAILFFGAMGYLIDQWRETSPWFLLVGLILGMIVGFYELAKTVWKQ